MLWRAISIRIRNYKQLPFNTNQAPYIPWQGKWLKFTSNFHSTQIKHLTFHGEEKDYKLQPTSFEHKLNTLHWFLGEKKPFVFYSFHTQNNNVCTWKCGKNKICFYDCWPKSLIVWETFNLSLWSFYLFIAKFISSFKP